MDRSKSYAGAGRMQIEPPYYGGGVGGGARPDCLRSYSYSAGAGGGAISSSYQYEHDGSSSKSSPSSKRWLWLALGGDPDTDRKRRVASYKAYAAEGRVKGSLRKSFKWIKDLVYGWS
jgi:hypothetical protein